MDFNTAMSVAGLSKHETAIYVALLKSGPSAIAKITRLAGLHRPIVYRFLPMLKEKGLVREIQKNKSVLFAANSPDKLQTLFSSFEKSFVEAVEELKALHRPDGKPIVVFDFGRDAIRNVFSDLLRILPQNGIFYRYTSSKDGARAESYLPKDYRKIRDEKKIQRFVISNVKRAKTKQPRLERAMRVVPASFDWFEDDVTMLIYGNKVAYIDYNSESVVLIENNFIAEFQKKLFKLLYSKL